MNIDFLKNITLFQNMSEDEIQDTLHTLPHHRRTYEKGEMILYAGDFTKYLCVCISGSVSVECNDKWGNRSILSLISPGDFFAEVYALLPQEPLQVDVCAVESSEILFLQVSDLLKYSIKNSWYEKFLRNIVMISSRKNLLLSTRAFHTSPKTARGRIMAYLNSLALRMDADRFDIPFDRQQMADYLNLDRTALSKELGKMKKDGLLDYRKNHFRLFFPDED